MAKLYVQFFRPKTTPNLNITIISAVCSFIKVLICTNVTLSGRLQELKNKGKVWWGNPKSGRCRLREWSLTRAFHYKI